MGARRRPRERRTRPLQPAPAGAFAALCLCWGSTFVPLKVVTASVPPLLAAGTRFVLAGGVLLLWTFLRHRRLRLSRDDVVRLTAPAALSITANYGLLAWGIAHAPSGAGAVVNLAVVPLSVWACAVVVRREAFTWLTLGGLVLGTAGLSLLVAHPIGGSDARGLLAIALGAAGYGVGTILAAPVARRRPATDVSAVQMGMGGLLLLAAAAIVERHIGGALVVLARPALLGAMVYLVGIGSLTGFTLYQYLLRVWPASQAAAYTFVSPLVALALGGLLAREQVTGRTLVASTLLLAGAGLAARRAVAAPSARR